MRQCSSNFWPPRLYGIKIFAKVSPYGLAKKKKKKDVQATYYSSCSWCRICGHCAAGWEFSSIIVHNLPSVRDSVWIYFTLDFLSVKCFWKFRKLIVLLLKNTSMYVCIAQHRPKWPWLGPMGEKASTLVFGPKLPYIKSGFSKNHFYCSQQRFFFTVVYIHLY